MTDPNRPSDDAVKPVQTGEPVVSKPYIMPDDPEEGSNEALTRELAEARDKMLRTLAEMENLRKRTAREVADARTYGISGFARDVLDIADNLQRALDAVPAEARDRDPVIRLPKLGCAALDAPHSGEERVKSSIRRARVDPNSEGDVRIARSSVRPGRVQVVQAAS